VDQQTRRRALVEMFCRCCTQYYGEDGRFDGPYAVPDERDRWWAAAILLAHGGQDEQRLAEGLMRHTFGGPEADVTRRPLQENLVDAANAVTLDWNIFQSNIATSVLANHGDRLADDVRGLCERIARRNTSRWAGSGQPDYIFQGANDNMPAHATCGLILAGQMLGIEQAVQDGRWRLQLFAEMLGRRGMASEFGSGTYLPLTVNAMAELSHTARDPEIRRMALAIEQQLWADVICSFHPGSGRCGAPMTRAYTVGSVGHLDGIMTLVWMVTGQAAFTDPVRYMIAMEEGQVTHFDGNAFKTAGEFVHSLLPQFHCPEPLVALATDRPYPFRFAASAEHIFSREPDGGGRDCHVRLYQTADGSLATSTHGFQTGNQSEKVRICYRRIADPASFKDTGTLIFRYLHNDERPGVMFEQEGGTTGEKTTLPDRAIARTVQHDNLAMLLTRGGGHLGDADPQTSRLRLSAIIPAHFHQPEAVFIGEEECDGFVGQAHEPAPVFVDFGRMYLVLYPLTLTDLGREALVRLETFDNYRAVSFLNYEGAPREFAEEELKEVMNGCVILMSDPDECGSFEAFRQGWKLDLVEDWWLASNRRTRVICQDTELLLNWSTPTDTVRCEAVNGRPIPRPALEATGLDNGIFPLLTGEPVSPMNLPLDNLDIAWYPWLKWQIGQRFDRRG